MKRLLLTLAAVLASAGIASAQTGTITANGQCRSIDTDNKGQGTLEVSGTWTGTLTWYVSNGVNRAAIDLGTPAAPGTAVNSTTANGHWEGNVGGWKTFEVCATAAMTGTATIWMNATNASSPLVFGSGGGGGGGDITIGGNTPDLGAGGVTANTLRVDLASDGSVANDISDSRSFLSNISDKISDIDSRLITSASYNQVANTQGDQVMFYASSTAPTAVTDGFAQRPWVDLNGRVQTNVSQLGGTATPIITATLGDDLANTQDGLAVVNLPYLFDGSTWDRAPGNSVTGAFVGGAVADGVNTAGNPLYIGGLSTTSIVGQTPVSTAQRIAFVGGADRVLINRPYANLEDRVSGVVGVTDGSSTSLVAAQGSGVRFCATNFIVSNSSATNVTVDIRDGTAGSVIATFPAAANMGGATVSLGVPVCTTANTAMAMDPSASATTVTVTAIGFKTEL